MSSKIIVLELVSGAHVIGESMFIEEEGHKGGIRIKKPMRLIPQKDGVGLFPLSPFSKDEIILLKNEAIMYMVSPDEKLVDAYKNQVSDSPIVVPETGIVDASSVKL